MRFWWLWAAKVRGVLTQKRQDNEFDAELESHLHLLTERYLRQGMSRDDAASAARRQFGNITLLRERQRAQRSFLSPAEWWGDIRFGLRMMIKKPGSNAAVVLALGLGIGMNGAVFTFVNALLLRPPAGVATGSLLEIWLHNRISTGVQSYLPFTYPDYAYFRDHSQSLEGVLAFDGDGSQAIWNRSGIGENVQGQLVSGNYFPLLRVNAELGRMISIGDDQLASPHPVVVLSHSFWQRRLGADSEIVGRTLVLNGAAFSIIGVAPPGFAGLLVATAPDFWAPLATQEQFTHDTGRISNRNSYWLIVAGRLGPGVDKAKAQAEMHVLAHQLELDYPGSNKNQDAVVYPATLVPGPYRGYVSAFTGLLLAVFALVLLIACVNAASLLLARASGRVREMAIRSALGAGRGRLIRQMLMESLLLSSIAGIAGVTLAWWMSRLLLELKPATLPITLEVPLDWRVLLFTLLVSLATGVIFGLVPALRGARVNPAPVLKEETQSAGLGKSRLRSLLLIGEIAACVVLLAGATLCVRSLMHANSIDPGFDTHHIAVATLDPGSLGYSPEKVAVFYRELLDHVLGLPGVTAASYVNYLPLGTSEETTSVGKRLAQDPDRSRVDVFRVDPGYFSTMGITLLRGRDFSQKESDSPDPGAVIVNEVLARRLWPGQDPIGKRFALGEAKTTSEVIGVVKAGKYRTLGEGPIAVVYRGTLPTARTIVIRTSGDARALHEEVRREVQVVDPMMAATGLQTIEQYMALPLFPARTTGLLLGASGILAVVLTAIGLFGVIAYVVSQRTHEIGVRMALGAQQTDVLKLVMHQGLYVTSIGLFIGLATACVAARLLAPLLYGIGANDPATLVGVAVGVTAVAMLACYVPARRAMRVDPAVALRYE
jgi:predicted permease